MELPQIKGAEMLVPGDFYPIAPKVDRQKETANKTTIVVFKPYAISELFYIHPVTKEMGICEPINTANVTYELNARDATYPFIVLVTYNYVNREIVVRQSLAAAVPVAPEKGAKELFLSSFTEQPIGTAQTEIPAIPSALKTRTLSKVAGTYTDVVDFQYISTFLTLTGNITVNDPAIITGDSLPTGKTIKVILPASAYSITWGSNYIPARLGAVLSTTVGEINEILIWKNDATGKYMYNIIVYSPTPYDQYKTRSITKAAGTYTDVVDFQYASTFLTLTGNITVNNPANLTGDSLPKGKTIRIMMQASAYTITWGADYIAARTKAVSFNLSGAWYEIVISQTAIYGKYMYDIIAHGTALDYFKTRALSKAAGTYTDVVDFQYSKTNLTLTGNITVNAPANLTNDSLPTGKVILIRVAASAFTITFSSDYKPSKAAMPQSTTSGDVNAISIWYDDIASKYMYDIIVY